MMLRFAVFLRSTAGTAAAEMALSLPILLVLMFGVFRARQLFPVRACRAEGRSRRRPLCGTAADDQLRLRTGPSVGSTADPEYRETSPGPGIRTELKRDLTAGLMPTRQVTLSCDCDTAHSYVNSGIYSDFPNGGAAPVITVSATVPYNTFFGQSRVSAPQRSTSTPKARPR